MRSPAKGLVATVVVSDIVRDPCAFTTISVLACFDFTVGLVNRSVMKHEIHPRANDPTRSDSNR